MPIITTFGRAQVEALDEFSPVAVKTYTVTVTIHTDEYVNPKLVIIPARTRCKVVSGLTNGHATACQIANDTAQALAAIWCGGKASVQCGPVVFGPVRMGHLPEAGFYVDGRLIKEK